MLLVTDIHYLTICTILIHITSYIRQFFFFCISTPSSHMRLHDYF